MTFCIQFNRLVWLATFFAGHAVAASGGCGSLANGVGPWDYRTGKDKLAIVEKYHFDSGVETLARGVSSTNIAGDIDYVLRASPNHHRALMAMMKLGLRNKSERIRGAGHSVYCYMERAERFQPDDAMVKVIFGLYYLNAGKSDEAIEKLEEARGLDSSNANVNYNLGLAYLRVRNYDKALESAHAAYRLGFPLPGLRRQLEQAGRWKAPAPEASPAGAEPELEAQEKN